MAQKYALVVGCNYPNTRYELKGCINDANSMNELLIKRFGFKESNIKLLTDQIGSCENKPTARNIKAVLNHFISLSQFGDVIYFSFAGHGTVIPARNSASNKDQQAIVPCDHNPITSIDFRKILHGVPEGVTFILLSDSCHSGGLIDQEKEQIGPNVDRQVVSTNQLVRMIPFEVVLQQLSMQTPINTLNIQTHFTQMFGSDASLIFNNIAANQFAAPSNAKSGILLSGCQANESSHDRMFDGIWRGAFTWTLINVIKEQFGPITNRELVYRARKLVEKIEIQHPCLYCSDENVREYFLCEK